MGVPFEWSSRYETGFETIDNQHKEIVGRINALFEAISSGKGSAVLGDTLTFLIAHIQEHFNEEERYMAEIKYVRREEHRRDHERLNTFLRGSTARAKVDNPNLCALALAAFLREWLLEHVLVEDRQLFENVRISKFPSKKSV